MADAPVVSIARAIDISAVRAHHAEADVRLLASRARDGDFVNAHVLPHWVPLLRELLEGSNTLVGAPVGFPAGGHATAVKVAEAEQLVADGAQELDVVINVARLRSADDAYVRRELDAVRAAVPRHLPLKVILETSLLSPDEVRRGAVLALETEADFVKTGTGWTGAVVDAGTVALVREATGGRIAVKASGGLRDLDTVLALREAGVARFGIGLDHASAIVIEERRRGRSNPG